MLAIWTLSVCLLVLAVVTLLFPGRWRACLVHAASIAALVGLAVATAPTQVRTVLLAVACVYLLVCWIEGRLTTIAALAALPVVALVISRYSPSWVLALVLLLGWAHFAGSLAHPHSGADAKTRDTTDLLPLIAVLLLGTLIVGSHPLIAGAVVFSAVSFIVNDVLASEFGAVLPGGAWLLPQFTPVPHGTPGAMSGMGTALGASGSLCAGVCAAALLDDPMLGGAVALAGIAAGVIDSSLSRTSVPMAWKRGHELVNSAGCLAAVLLGLLVGLN